MWTSLFIYVNQFVYFNALQLTDLPAYDNTTVSYHHHIIKTDKT